jgi:hypothetical protein
MPEEVKNSHIAMFADNSKCYKCITSEADCAALQEDLIALSDWAELNKLEFQPRKCENLRISRNVSVLAASTELTMMQNSNV